METPSSLPLPTICSGGESSSENQGREGTLRTASGSSLASTAVALPTAQHVDKPSPDPTEQAEPSQQPPEQDTPNGGVQPHDTSRLACIRNGLESQGFQKTLPSSFAHLGGSLPLSHTRQRGSGGQAGVINGKSILFRHLS